MLVKGKNILLGMKKIGLGAGRWNGFGGKVEIGETIEDAVKREVYEEVGVTTHEIEQIGILEFSFEGQEDVMEAHIYKSQDFTGEPKESNEMRPKWFDLHAIPYSEMWQDDIFWLPLLLAGKKFTGKFHFGENDTILEHELNEAQEIK